MLSLPLPAPALTMRSTTAASRRQTDSSPARTSCARVVDRLSPSTHAVASSLYPVERSPEKNGRICRQTGLKGDRSGGAGGGAAVSWGYSTQDLAG